MTKMVNRTLYPVRARKVCSLLAPFIFQIPINCLAQLIIPSAEMEPDQILATKPLVGFKTLPQEMFDIAHANRATGIPVDFFVASAASTAKVVTSMEGQGQDPSTATPADWWRASKWSMSVSTEKSAKPKLETWQFPGKPDTIYDPELIVSLADTELFVSKNPVIYASYVGDQKLEWIQADPHAWTALIKYQTLTTTRIRSDWEAPNLFVTVNDIVASYPRMKNTMRFESGHVSFGKVVIQTPKDAGLKVSPHVTGKGDLFVLKLSVSFHDLGSLTDKDIEEQTFGVEILSPKDVYASDLIPLKYDALPDASTQNVSVGRYHEQEFIYASLRPIVVAAGLQETRFSWKLSGGAVGVGTRRFVAIVRVPNDAMSLIMTLSANLKSHTWGLPFETIRHADHRTDVKLPKR